MKSCDIYKWLMENVPTKEDTTKRSIWSNLASYLYFMRVVDMTPSSENHSEYQTMLQLADEYDVQIPNKEYNKVIDIVRNIENGAAKDPNLINKLTTYYE